MPATSGKRGRMSSRFRPRLEILENPTLLSVWTVDRLTDTGMGSGTSGDFRYCLTHAVSEDSVTFDVTGIIDLTRPLAPVSANLTIEGPGAENMTVERGNTGEYRIFDIAAGASRRRPTAKGATTRTERHPMTFAPPRKARAGLGIPRHSLHRV
jgi:hypothetical protein